MNIEFDYFNKGVLCGTLLITNYMSQDPFLLATTGERFIRSAKGCEHFSPITGNYSIIPRALPMAIYASLQKQQLRVA
jgi:hypothetical protein